MANQVKLHHAQNEFNSLIKETSDFLGIREVFIIKDYWITLVLKCLADSEYSNLVVFKGGTSLSKAYKLIKRFSEDVDIAIIDASGMTGNQLKSLIRNVEKTITKNLTEIDIPGVTSKGSQFRKSVFTYPVAGDSKQNQGFSDKLIVETNSFANPFPYVNMEIKSLICEFVESTGKIDLIKKYGLEPFNLNILDKKRTLIEKIVALIRISFSENPTISIAEKIRHFYDIYFLLNDSECLKYFNSGDFLMDINELIKHDRAAFDEPMGWGKKSIHESPLFYDFDLIWNNNKATYVRELSSLAFAEIPNEKDVATSFKLILEKLNKI
jgi:predicted nucleotidyltransferase component of viral defense system